MDEHIDFLLSYNVILVCNLHANAGILHHYFSILWVTSQYYFALQCLRKALPSTTLYIFVLQSLHKVLPSTTLYYKACTKHFPVLLCTTKLAQTTSQYYFVLQSLHEQTLRYAFGKDRIIWDEHPKSPNHQLNAILPMTNQHTQNLEFCMLIVISYVIS